MEIGNSPAVSIDNNDYHNRSGPAEIENVYQRSLFEQQKKHVERVEN